MPLDLREDLTRYCRLSATPARRSLESRPSQGRRPWLRQMVLFVAQCIIVGVPATASAALPCSTKTIGLDSTQTNTSTSPVLGEAIGQVFTTDDTLIQSITVWRLALDSPNFNGIKLYITELNALGIPDALDIILDGPVVFMPYGDGVNPIPINYVFDPPFALPHRGLFCFALQTSPHCYGSWNIYSNKSDPYPTGSMWIFARSDCFLREGPNDYPDVDLTFRIRFCDSSTSASERTWGTLKIRYRY